MKIIIIGATGLIGSAVVKELSPRHEIITLANTSGDLRVDICNEKSIEAMYQQVGKVDAVISTAGKVIFDDFKNLTPEKYQVGLQDKLMGQVNLVRIGMDYLNDHGSFTLTSGVLNVDPIRTGTSASMINGALEGFVRSAAIELPRNLRINVVSPTVITEALPKYGPYFRGFKSVSVADAALAYSKSVEGLQTGQVYRVGF